MQEKKRKYLLDEENNNKRKKIDKTTSAYSLIQIYKAIYGKEGDLPATEQSLQLKKNTLDRSLKNYFKKVSLNCFPLRMLKDLADFARLNNCHKQIKDNMKNNGLKFVLGKGYDHSSLENRKILWDNLVRIHQQYIKPSEKQIGLEIPPKEDTSNQNINFYNINIQNPYFFLNNYQVNPLENQGTVNNDNLGSIGIPTGQKPNIQLNINQQEQETVKTLLQKAVLHKSKKETGDAILLLNRILKIEKNIEALELLGDIFYEQDNFDQAFIYYSEILKLNPTHEEALLCLGYISTIKKNNQAVFYFNKAISLYPTNVDSYAHLADWYLSLNDKESALNLLNQALQIESDIDCIIKRGLLFISFGEYEKAEKDLFYAIHFSNDVDNADLRNFIKQLQEKNPFSFEKVLGLLLKEKEYSKIISLTKNEQDPIYLHICATACYALKMYSNVVAICQKAILVCKDKKTLQHLYLLSGLGNYYQNAIEGAKHDYNNARAMVSDNMYQYKSMETLKNLLDSTEQSSMAMLIKNNQSPVFRKKPIEISSSSEEDPWDGTLYIDCSSSLKKQQ